MALKKTTLQLAMNSQGLIGRRKFLQTVGVGAFGVGTVAGVPVSITDWIALQAADLRKREMGCILLWMSGRAQPT